MEHITGSSQRAQLALTGRPGRRGQVSGVAAVGRTADRWLGTDHRPTAEDGSQIGGWGRAADGRLGTGRAGQTAAHRFTESNGWRLWRRCRRPAADGPIK